MNINYISGDATNPVDSKSPKFILHVVNNMGGWGNGFVLAISKKWKLPEIEYRNWAKYKEYSVPFQLGNVLISEIPNSDIRIIHLLAQNGYMSPQNPQPLDYNALKKCLYTAYEHVSYWKGSVHMPKIGTGLAGGKWEFIENIIKKLSFHNVETFIYTI